MKKLSMIFILLIAISAMSETFKLSASSNKVQRAPAVIIAID